ncbi:MAG: NFACT family protein [Leptolyngbya sp. UWPOB_LEPTO1]|uniref:Rqc2 family fibronectin-binding protein n=1 Tax=Leptolyngbya sp. UWPOB_LEPTO1 TaxID=2815653 RepID=UPI001ACE0F6F|nr:NFACT RNA binding domain-containing protein [Leptolyngbya sp. UWPOB_LEPTO1]MBN8561205.1 NFACT family protein [Leptolyngbya sp. UWPOB_LEPTO1]
MQPVDFTTLMAVCAELRSQWLPARFEQAYQRDRFTVLLALRTLKQRGWLTLSWHPQAARMHMSEPPPRDPDTFTFSQQLRHQLGGLALVAIEPVSPWERAIDLQFAHRPGEPALWHLYIEIMGQYSNAILVNQENAIVTAAHQVSSNQSSVRPIQTGQPYELPPARLDPAPSLAEDFERWKSRIALVPGAIRKNLVKAYRGLSSSLVLSMVKAAEIQPDRLTDEMSDGEWQRLFECWQFWLKSLEAENFQPGFTSSGYTVLWGQGETSVQNMIDRYYRDQLNQQVFTQLLHQITQRLNAVLGKLRVKAEGFESRLDRSDRADQAKQQADLLMAHLHMWEPGMQSIELCDFETGEPVTIPLDPEKNAVLNAQSLYKQHQKLKRTRAAIEPLLKAVQDEMFYLEEIETAIAQFDRYETPDDLKALEEIRDELVQEGYLEGSEYRKATTQQDSETQPYRYKTPGGFELLIGRNNRQNDQLTFRTATEYDLWFHTQEIPGSHVLLRLEPGAIADEKDLQFTANLAAFHSRARQSEQVPVVYTEPKHVYKPNGAKPGTVIYKQERVIWGQPQQGREFAISHQPIS